MNFRSSFFILLLIVISLFPVLSSALEVDDKLTLRILKVSDSKKTVLINRGIEDGLAKDNHAKFFLTTGVVARGVISEISPTRSVWSLYRVVNSSYIKTDVVMNLKITDPVQVTEDPTKMIVMDDIVKEDKSFGIPLADGADDLDKITKGPGISNLTPEELTMEGRNLEISGMINLSSLSSKATPDVESIDAVSGSNAHMDLSIGGDYYFMDKDKWYSTFSLSLFAHLESHETLTGMGQIATTNITEYGGGVSWHPFERHDLAMTPIFYFTAALGMGSAEDSYTFNSSRLANENDSITGKLTTMSVGAGMKYYLLNGFGLRLTADYFVRSINYNADSFDTQWTMNQSGYRIYSGLAYRF